VALDEAQARVLADADPLSLPQRIAGQRARHHLIPRPGDPPGAALQQNEAQRFTISGA